MSKKAEVIPTVPKATHSGTLKIGDLAFPCSVLADGRRLLSQNSFIKAMRIRKETEGKRLLEKGGSEIPMFLPILKPKRAIEHPEYARWVVLQLKIKPVEFVGANNNIWQGILAEYIPDICRIWIDAAKGELLTPAQLKVAIKAEQLLYAMAKVGIIALIDEATGFQETREGKALQKILDKFLMDDPRKWSKQFPDQFWTKLLKAKGYSTYTKGHVPSFVGHWINDIVYDRLAPGIRDRLKLLNPRKESGQLRYTHHQFLTEDIGIKELRDHLTKAMTLMDVAETPEQFKILIDKVLPKYFKV